MIHQRIIFDHDIVEPKDHRTENRIVPSIVAPHTHKPRHTSFKEETSSESTFMIFVIKKDKKWTQKTKKRLIKSLHSDFTWIDLMDSQTGRRRKKYCPATFISYSLSPSLTWSDVAVIPLIFNHIWSMASTASPQRRTHHSDSTQGYRKMTTEGLMFGSTNISSTSSNILPVTPRVPYIWVRDHR